MALVRGALSRMGNAGAVYVGLIAVLGAATVPASVLWLILGPHGTPLVILSLFASSALCGALRLHIGKLSDMPYLGVSLGLLAVSVYEPNPYLCACIWASGYLVSQLVGVRDVLWSFYRSGVSLVAAIVYVMIAELLHDRGVWPILFLALASVAGMLVKLVGELVRQRGRWAMDGGVGLSALRGTRLVLVASVTTLLSLFIYYADSMLIPLLESDPTARRTPLVLIVAGVTLFGIAQAVEGRAMKRRLSALMAAADNSTWDGGKGPIQTTLLGLARAATNAEMVEVRSEPAGPREISARLELGSATEPYLVASRPLGAPPFARADQRVLATLAQMASEADRIRNDIDTLAKQARTDPLTGLPNYGALQEALVEANENRPSSRGIAVLFIDLDDFKRLNDNRGHHIGDEVLKVIAARLLDSVDAQDVVSRIGGDEFVIILKNLSSINDAKAIADRIVVNVGQPFSVDGMELRPGISVGLAYSSHREIDPKNLVTDADRTMLHLKRSRRQGGMSEGSSVSIASHRSTRMNDIVTRAIRHRRITLAFQPIVDLNKGTIWAFESLIRYIDPELGPISPSSLVARAKSLGMLDELTRHVMELSLEGGSIFRELVDEVHHITVNFELAQITDDRLGPAIQEAVAAHPNIKLCIELNERSLIELNEPLREQVLALQKLGALIALDDYGSQDSSVAALVRLPMDVLKIDKSLVDDLSDVRHQEVIKALQGFGNSLGYTLVVEGVESAGAEQTLKGLGVQMAQGFYYGRPQNLAATIRRLKATGARGVLEGR